MKSESYVRSRIEAIEKDDRFLAYLKKPASVAADVLLALVQAFLKACW